MSEQITDYNFEDLADQTQENVEVLDTAIQSKIFVSTIVLEDDKVLMIREGKNNYGQRGTWSFPGGHAEYGEGLIEAAEREFLEESGYSVKINGVAAIQKKDFNNSMNVVVFFSGERTDEAQVEPEDGTDTVEFVPIDKIPELNIRFPELIRMAGRVACSDVVSADVLTYESDMTRSEK